MLAKPIPIRGVLVVCGCESYVTVTHEQRVVGPMGRVTVPWKAPRDIQALHIACYIQDAIEGRHYVKGAICRALYIWHGIARCIYGSMDGLHSSAWSRHRTWRTTCMELCIGRLTH